MLLYLHMAWYVCIFHVSMLILTHINTLVSNAMINHATANSRRLVLTTESCQIGPVSASKVGTQQKQFVLVPLDLRLHIRASGSQAAFL